MRGNKHTQNLNPEQLYLIPVRHLLLINNRSLITLPSALVNGKCCLITMILLFLIGIYVHGFIYMYISGIDCFCIRLSNMEVPSEKFFLSNWIFVGRNFILHGVKLLIENSTHCL